MALETLKLTNLRNFDALSLNLSPDINIITGPNGSGKTSILEAIYLLSTGRSFRCTNLHKVIKFNTDQAAIYAKTSPLGHTIGYQRHSDRHKELKFNDKPISSIAEIARHFPVCCIDGNSFRAVIDAPVLRRKIFDWGVFHVEHDFMAVWKSYSDTLKQRNKLLHKNNGLETLDYWDKLFAKTAEQLIAIRYRYYTKISEYFNRSVGLLINKSVDKKYKISLELKNGSKNTDYESILTELKLSRHLDIERGYTSIGPHKFDIVVKTNGVIAKDILSRGQQKVAILALYLAQLHVFKQFYPDKNCIVIIDDLAAELDRQSIQLVYEQLIRVGHQVIISSIEADSRWLADIINAAEKDVSIFALDELSSNVSRETV